MKKILLLLFFCGAYAQAQIVNVPDPGLLYNLLQNGVDTNGDGQIQVAEAQATTTLSLHYLISEYIENLTGLEAFVNLTSLEMNGWNSLQGQILDVSMMPNLVTLNCSVDRLSGINVTGLAHLETLLCEFNEFTTLDLSGCTSLKTLDCSDTNLSTLNLSTVPNLETLKASNCEFLTSINFNAAPVLKNINCSFCQLSAADVSLLTQLEYLDLTANHLTTLNLGTISNLTQLYCQNNLLTSLDVAAQIQLVHLSCGDNQLSAIDVTSLSQLKFFDCSFNQITSLSLQPSTQLQQLGCRANQLTSLNLSGLSALTSLDIAYNGIAAIDFSPAANLIDLRCNNNPLGSPDFSVLTHLTNLTCEHIAATTLDASVLPALRALYCGDQLSSLTLNNPNLSDLGLQNSPLLDTLNLNACPALEQINIGGAALSVIDFSGCPLMHFVSVSNLPNLTYVNAKNGNYLSIFASQTPNLSFICADEVNIPYLINDFPNVVINSYCSFTPGGNFNTISGVARFDGNGNGCDANDMGVPYMQVSLNDGTQTGATYLNAQSAYTFYTDAGNYTLSVQLENPSYFNVSTIAPIVFPNTNGATATRDICITPNGIQPDAEILIVPTSNARPGFDSHYELVVRNKGNQTLSGNITLGFDDAVLDFVWANPSAVSTAGQLSWDYSNLVPFEVRALNVVLNLNSPMETPAVNDGDFLDFTANMSYSVNDADVHYTDATLHQIVVNSLDPNDKTCLEGNAISPDMIGDYVHYNINFENIGTAPAQNVVVKDVIDAAQFDISTLQVIYASHPVVTRVNGNTAEFIFENINLPGTSGENKGNVVFKIKTKPTLALGDQISNKAEIFFDYNFPIETNEATSTFAVLKNKSFVTDASISIYPNPVKNVVTIEADNNLKSAALFDLQGRLLQTLSTQSRAAAIDISNYPSGVYLLDVRTEKGNKTEKLVKE